MNEMKEYKYIHIFFNCPRLGLFLKGTDTQKAVKKIKKKIWKQLKYMNNNKFLQYCELRLFEDKPEWMKSKQYNLYF